MRKSILALLGLAVILSQASQTPAAKADAIAILTSLSGKVAIRPAQAGNPRPARLGEQLFENDVLETRKDSNASLLFADGSIIHIIADTSLTLSLREKPPSGSQRLSSLSKDILSGVKGVFSGSRKKETLSAVPGIRKKIEESAEGVRVLFPRNSAIMTDKPVFHWQTKGGRETFTVSLTLKGMEGKLWSISTERNAILYPPEREGLKRGQTYFLRVESGKDGGIYDEVFFRVLDESKADEARRLANQMEELREKNPDDITPLFVLATYYRQVGLYHDALLVLEALAGQVPGEAFVLEERREIYSKLGLWQRWEEVNMSLQAMK